MRSVELAGTELRIDGVPRVLLCASLFPFRVPREQWRDRIAAVARLGYHALDVYVPWNFHETEPDIWDFSGQRDIEHFLELARAAGLLVLARPGPYICSEWDGGGLPAWLPLTDGLRLRQNEPRYLAEVERWFRRIMPILARHQHTRGGPVMLVQVENELDFFDCDDPGGYVEVLARSARTHGIEVPLVACAGQGDIVRAGGTATDVAAAVNLYPDDDSSDVERHAAHYEEALRKQDLPLLVTETNRLHRTLKRLLVCGARLLGPYLQASGWNGEYGTAVNNWGDVLGFMTHDYDFGGVLDPAGAERPDAVEARRLAALVDALGPRLAAAVPVGEYGPAYALDLHGGGQLLSLTNLADADISAEVDESLTVTVPAASCLLLVRDLPLPGAGVRLTATAELTGLAERPGEAVATFATRGHTEIQLTVSGDWSAQTEGDVRADTLRVTGSNGSVLITTAVGALRLVFEPAQTPPPARPTTAYAVTSAHVSGPVGAWRTVTERTAAQPLERLGVYCGAGRYRTAADLRGVTGLVLRSAADVIDVRVASTSLGWVASGGGDLWLPLPDPAQDADLIITARIWGHSNFDDGRLPALRLGSLRGIAGVLAVTDITRLSEGWLVGPDADPSSAPPPRGGLGGWMTACFPQTIRYRRVVDRPGPAALRVKEGQARLDVALNGTVLGTITPLTPVLWLDDLRQGDELTVDVHRAWGEPTGDVELLRGRLIEGWDVAAQGTAELLTARRGADLVAAELPVAVPAGQARWLHLGDLGPASDANVTVRFRGAGLLATALAGGRNLGRVWIGPPPPGATLRGGRGDLLVIPAPWLRDGLDLYLESTTTGMGQLDEIIIDGPIDAPSG
ncbi:beta-galactosidase [Nonomuraea sp. NPDC049646]|uniref:beta-galactosidase n=1 Tax=unclassified Nonomuraea TaxID=2593643 RepID=UPI00378F1D25